MAEVKDPEETTTWGDLGSTKREILWSIARCEADPHVDAITAGRIQEDLANRWLSMTVQNVHIHLNDLEDCGLVRKTTIANDDTGGRRRKQADLTADGRAMLRQALRFYQDALGGEPSAS